MEAQELIDIGSEIKRMIEDVLVESPEITFQLILVDTKEEFYVVEGKLCELCAKETLDMHIENYKLKHRDAKPS